MIPLADLVAFARDLAASARRETLRSWRRDHRVENKDAHGRYDPVTAADTAAERVMRDLIAKRFPQHAIHGEELPEKHGTGRYAWSLDPIDGTRSYICGLPTWTTLVALLEHGEPVLGLIDAPCVDEIYVGTVEEAILIQNGKSTPIRASGCNRIEDARFSTTDPFLLGPREDIADRVLRAVRVTRYGYDGYAYACLAAGSIDLVIEAGLKAHDYNAHIPLVRAAGGYIGDWAGGCEFAAGDVIAAASRELYDAAVELLGEA